MTPRTAVKRRRPYAARASSVERKAQLLDAALALILRDGYQRLSIDAIAKEAGVTRPVVYSVFKGRNDLLTALLDRQQARALEQLVPLLAVVPDEETPLQDLVAQLTRALAKTVADDPDTWRPILVAAHGMPAAVRSRIDSDRQRVRDHIGVLIGAVSASSGVRVDVDVLAHAAVALLEHFGQLMLERPTEFTVDRVVGAVDATLSLMLDSGRRAGA